MIANFTVLSGETVPENYVWDIGLPFTSTATSTTAYSTTEYISGYAPGLKVVFENTSTIESGYEYINYIWNFGDYYNTTNNIVSLSAYSGVEHLYLMPGKYNVSLTIKQARLVPTVDPQSKTCIGKYDIRWFWDELLCEKQNNITWNETECNGSKAKWWDSEYACLQKHCKVWSWHDLKLSANNPVTWEQSKFNTEFEKKWAYEANDIICTVNDANFLKTLDVLEYTTIKTAVVEVVEQPPKARLICLTAPITGYSPYTVALSPKASITGSFPIDRIDWDFNDGTPIKTATRYSTPDLTYFSFTNTFFDDPKDPRNYDAIYTYKRNINSYSVFYPSITCYSANTSKTDACSISIGPILLQPLQEDFKVLKTRNTDQGILYAFSVDKNLFFGVKNNTLTPVLSIIPSIPQNALLNNYIVTNFYYGNPGLNYPPITNPRPFYIPPDVDFNYLTVEEPPQIPLLTEDNILIKVNI